MSLTGLTVCLRNSFETTANYVGTFSKIEFIWTPQAQGGSINTATHTETLLGSRFGTPSNADTCETGVQPGWIVKIEMYGSTSDNVAHNSATAMKGLKLTFKNNSSQATKEYGSVSGTAT
jgi:hypothetical protein